MAPGEHPHIVALARDVERNGRRVTELDTLVRQFSADIEAMMASLSARDTDGGGVVRSWLLTEDIDQARTDLADLVVWLGQVFLAFPDAALPSCWLWHPWVVEELRWLRSAHADAYGPDGTWARVGDWHERHRPGVVNRLTVSLGCELAVHDAPASSSRTVPLGDHTSDAAEQWAKTKTAPRPTAQQLRDAQHYDAQQHRNHRSA